MEQLLSQIIEVINNISVLTKYDYITLGVNIASVLVAFAVACFTYKIYKRQLILMEEQKKISEQQTSISKSQSQIMEQQNKISLFDKRHSVCMFLTNTRIQLNTILEVKKGTTYYNVARTALPNNTILSREYYFNFSGQLLTICEMVPLLFENITEANITENFAKKVIFAFDYISAGGKFSNNNLKEDDVSVMIREAIDHITPILEEIKVQTKI